MNPRAGIIQHHKGKIIMVQSRFTGAWPLILEGNGNITLKAFKRFYVNELIELKELAEEKYIKYSKEYKDKYKVKIMRYQDLLRVPGGLSNFIKKVNNLASNALKNHFEPCKYGFPKGMIEHNEETIDAAIREMYEETGILFTKKELEKCAKIEINTHFGLHHYWIVNSNKNPYIKNNSEIKNVEWVDISLKNMYKMSKFTRSLLLLSLKNINY